MATVYLSPLAGAGWQFFDNSGIPLAGGKIYTYAAGTSTPQETYTSVLGTIQCSNPIVLDATGRTPYEVWLVKGYSYKFVIKDANDVLIGTYDNISGENDPTEILDMLANTSNNSLGDALIGFKQSNSSGFYTNAVARTVNTKFQEILSVKDFGAVGDGTTDDTNAVTNAINAANGKSLYFPSGNYKITSTITMANLSNMTLFGEPFASKISVSSSINLFIINSTCSNIVFDGIEFAGASISNDGKTAIHTWAAKTILQNCYIHNWTNGFKNSNENANDCKVINNYFTDIGSSGAGSGNGYAVYNIGLRFIVTGNTFNNVARHDVYLSGSSPQGSQYCVVSNNTSIDCGIEAIALYNTPSYDAVRYCVVANNTIKNNKGSRAIGLDVNTCDNIVANNTIINAAQYGIYLEGGIVNNSYPNRNTISGNNIIDAGNAPIRCLNGGYNVFVGNTLSYVNVTPVYSYGIQCSYTTNTVFPTGNIVGVNSFYNVTNPVSIDQDTTTGIYCGIEIKQQQELWVTATSNSSVPSVKDAKHIILNNSSSTTITDLLDGSQGQEVTLYFNNANTTISLANFYLAGFVTFTGQTNDTLTLIKKGIYWYEKCRSINH